MILYKKYLLTNLVLIFILLSVSPNAQTKDPDEILQKVKDEFKKVEDYIVNVRIKVDVSFLKIPEREAKIYFKQPDKIHIESEGFAMLPKQGLNFSPLGLLESKYTAFYEKNDVIKDIPVVVIKVIPLESNSDIILSTFWIDTARNLILKIESSRRPTGLFTIELDYKQIEKEYVLPSSMIFTFTVDPSLMPRGFSNEMEDDAKKENGDDKKFKTGKVFINYYNYKVNTGIKDDFFEKKNDN
jgi:outer membrane lipoprotein-sorting protein